MNSQQLQQPSLIASQSNKRRWQWLSIGIIGSIAAVAIAFSTAPVRDRQAQPITVSVAIPAAIDPAAQSVNAYLQAHASVDQTQALDPAVQSVNSYLNAHASVRQVAAIDPAVQSVNEYLRAQASVSAAQVLDPAAQSVNAYLQAHSR